MNTIEATAATMGSRVRDCLRARFASSWRDLDVPPEYRVRINEAMKVPVRLAFDRARVLDAAELRLTTIEGPGTEIFALMVFPDDPSRVPVFASEFVVFGKIVRAAVVDLQPAGMSSDSRGELDRALAPLAAANPDLLASGELPDWCRDYFTRGAVFALRREMADLPRLETVLADYVDAWSRLCTHGGDSPPSAALDAYKSHHVVHTPGRPYLEKMFGIEWTEAFLRNAMYA